MEIIDKARAWRDADIDPDTREELDQLIVQADASNQEIAGPARDELAEAFAGPLQFGTAGLRGRIGPGPARMNRVVVTQAAAGFARWLEANGHGGGTVIVGYDARHKSAEFARDTAEIFRGAGFEVLLTDEPTPTPVVAFGIKHFGCVAGIVVTASHNPPQDNGYKVYLGDGSQIVPPADAEIAAEIRAVADGTWATLPRAEGWRIVGDELREAYVARVATLVPDAKEVNWVHTAMHGVGSRVVRMAAERAGFAAAHEVTEQAEPDPEFPTASFPNPEEPGAIDLALQLAEQHDADVVVANDPDADRCAVAAKVGGKWRMLTGDELGSILGDDALRRAVPGVFANSIVSSTLLRSMAEANGRDHQTTLTGFKWIGRVPNLGFGYEEAIGYCVDPQAVPDKDGIATAMTVLRLVGELKAEGRSLADRLDEIAVQYGLHATSQLAVRVADLSIISDAMARLRANPPAELLGEPVKVTDLTNGLADLPGTDAVLIEGEQVRVVCRPSGTEPKLKCYLQVRFAPDGSLPHADADKRLQQLRAEIAGVLGVKPDSWPRR